MVIEMRPLLDLSDYFTCDLIFEISIIVRDISSF